MEGYVVRQFTLTRDTYLDTAHSHLSCSSELLYVFLTQAILQILAVPQFLIRFCGINILGPSALQVGHALILQYNPFCEGLLQGRKGHTEAP